MTGQEIIDKIQSEGWEDREFLISGYDGQPDFNIPFFPRAFTPNGDECIQIGYMD